MAVRSLTTSQNNSVHAAVVVAIALVVALFAFSDALFELVKRWIAEEEYSHGFLIPLVSAWILWMRRDALPRQFWSAIVDRGLLLRSLWPCTSLVNTVQSIFFRRLASS